MNGTPITYCLMKLNFFTTQFDQFLLSLQIASLSQRTTRMRNCAWLRHVPYGKMCPPPPFNKSPLKQHHFVDVCVHAIITISTIKS